MAATQVILLERIEKLGTLGEVVNVKPGYARNYLFPQKKALRATKANIAYFDGQRKSLEADSDKRKKEAEALAKKLNGVKAPLIRAASESGHLYGSVTSRDIAEQVAAASGEAVTRNMVDLNQSFKSIGLFPVEIILHPEVKAEIIINIARTVEEAEIQASTGRAMVADAVEEEAVVETEVALEDVMEDDALEAEKGKLADEAEKTEAEEAKTAEKSAERAAKKAAKAEIEAENADAPTEMGETSEAAAAPEAEEAKEEVSE